MKNKCYKIKRTDTQLYWSGYGSSFTQKGATWNTAADAAYSLKTQLGYRHDSIRDWLPKVVIVEYEIQTIEVGEEPAHHQIILSNFLNGLTKEHGREFVKHYTKMQTDSDTKDKYSFAIQVQHSDFKEFREDLKRLGYSSRNYKKTDSWLWVENDDVVVNMKLIDGATKIINLKELKGQYQDMVANFDFKKI